MRVGEDPREFLEGVVEKLEAAVVVQLPVRSLLRQWGVARRGAGVVSRIERDLLEYGLRTVPRFDLVKLDAQIAFERVSSTDVSDQNDESDIPAEATRTIGAVASAGLISVAPDDPIVKVQSLMIRHDFSQLPVLSSPRKVRGIVRNRSLKRYFVATLSVLLAT